MYYIIIREIHMTKNFIAWSESEFLFREYARVTCRRYPHSIYHMESCSTEQELEWIFKKYGQEDNKISNGRIVLVYDRTKTIYGITTCRFQRVGLAGRNLFKTEEDSIRCNYVHNLFWLILYLKRFSSIEESLIELLYHLVDDKYLDRHSVDMFRYFIDKGDQPGFYKL